MFWYILAAVVAVTVLVMNRRLARQRARALAVVQARPEVDVSAQSSELAGAFSMDAVDLRRIWLALAQQYDIPGEKLRTADRLDGELSRLFGQADHEPFLSSLFLGRRKLVEKYFGSATTWGELVVAIRNIELQTGRLATVASQDQREHVWAP